MTVIGLMRIRNEARWIERSVSSILLVCDRVVVLDDHSTDHTAALCRKMHCVEVIDSPFEGLDEARDKNLLLDHVRSEADWVLMIDGDEILHGDACETLPTVMASSIRACISFPVLYAWDREDQIRVDGVYGDFRRQSAFRPGKSRFYSRGGANFHCGNVPADLRASTGYVEIPLLHLGYMHRADRIRKYEWYNREDPNNHAEDSYRHMVIGDLFPAGSEFRHGGPLKLIQAVRDYRSPFAVE